MPVDASPEPDHPASAPAPAAGELLLDQAAVDGLSGYVARPARRPPSADSVRALAEAPNGPPEALPLLPVLGRRLAGLLTTAFRDPFGDEVEVSLAAVEPARYGEILDGLVLPLHLVTFRAEGWARGGLVAIGPDFARMSLDVLLGAPRALADTPMSARPFTALEGAILGRLVVALLRETERAFSEVAPVRLATEAASSDPRFAAIARDTDPVWALRFAFAIGARSAGVSLVIPHAALEPVLPQLRHGFLDPPADPGGGWAHHLAAELGRADIAAEAVLHEMRLPLGRILELGIGETLMFDRRPTDLVSIRCGGRTITRGRIGRVDGRIAVEIAEPLQAGRGGETEHA